MRLDFARSICCVTAVRGAALLLAVPAMAGVLAASHAAQAQTAPANPDSVPAPDLSTMLAPQSMGKANPLEKPNRNYNGLSLGDWMLSPTIMLGAAFDDNVFQSHSLRQSALGTRINPGFRAVRDSGMYKSTLYANFDGRIYPSLTRADTYEGSAGLEHIWQAGHDLTFRFLGDYSHKTDINNNGVVLTPGGAVINNVTPQHYHLFTGAASVNKSFGTYFASFGTQAQATRYDDSKDSLGQVVSMSARDGTVYTFTGRTGVWVSPALFVFVEPSSNIRKYQSGLFDSTGYRVIGGLGSDHISLFKGEVYGGYQRQNYADARFGTTSGSNVGGKLAWYPTQAATLSASLDETIGDSTVFTPSNPNGSSTYVTTAALKGDYALSRQWATSARFAYSQTSYLQSTRKDDRYDASAKLDYTVFANFGLFLEYAYARVISTVTANSYDRNIVTLGATYKY